MKRMVLGFLVGAFAVGGASAQMIFIERARIEVRQVDADSFELLHSVNASNAVYWCAAAIYAERKLGMARGQLYVETPYGPVTSSETRRGVGFTTAETPGAFTSVDQGVRTAGKTLRIGHAKALCFNGDVRVEVRDGNRTLRP